MDQHERHHQLCHAMQSPQPPATTMAAGRNARLAALSRHLQSRGTARAAPTAVSEATQAEDPADAPLQPARLPSDLAPSDEDIALFNETGVLVLRGCLSPDELGRLTGPQRAAFESLEYDGRDQVAGGVVYPAPGVYSMGPKILETAPETGAVSCGHPKIVAAVEALFGEPAVLAQYWSIMRPPGAGVPDNAEWVPVSVQAICEAPYTRPFSERRPSNNTGALLPL